MFKKPFQDLLDKICKPTTSKPLDLSKMRPVLEPRGGADRGDCEIWVPDDRRSEAVPFKEEDEISLG